MPGLPETRKGVGLRGVFMALQEKRPKAEPFGAPDHSRDMGARHGMQFIDPSGVPAFDGVFLQAFNYEGDVARVVGFDGRMQLVDARGQRVGPSGLDFIEPFVHGFALANRGGSRASGRLRGGTWQLLDPSGQLHGAGVDAELVLPVQDGHACVLAGGQWGFMNTQGELVVKPRYKFLGCHSEGVAVAGSDTGDVYIDHAGAVVLPGPFEEATDFACGLARVKVGGKWGIIDRSGAFVHSRRLGPLWTGWRGPRARAASAF
jgi:hypothetical protein